MHWIDWFVLLLTLVLIVAYGVWKTRNVDNTESFLLGDRNFPWWMIGLSIMATQASAITFLSTPGQAYEDGMRFVQFYFGLPLAMVILAIFVLPIYYRLKVYTAYEFLENRFNLSTRTLTSILFMIQRGLAAGITIYAPSIILSSILDLPLTFCNLLIGILVIIYTVAGGTQAVSQTQKQQMFVIMTGMFIAFLILLNKLPSNVGLFDGLQVAGKMGRLNVVDFEFDLSNRYNFWSGMLGGTFLFLSYFGTDQSQVQRYLGGKSLTESRLGLMFNGIFKVPMQFFILLVGVMVFLFYQWQQPPLHYNTANVALIQESEFADDYEAYQKQYDQLFQQKKDAVNELVMALDANDAEATRQTQEEVNTLMYRDLALRNEVKNMIKAFNPDLDTEDTDYVFITFVTQHLPIGLIGLLLAVIFSAAMSSTSSELNALATTTVVDIYRRSVKRDGSDRHYLKASRRFTIMWGIIALLFATFASLFENLIEAVNIIGSIFYGTILGIFVVAFFFKYVKGRAVFIAALIAELLVIIIFFLDYTNYIEIAYLWLNALGCGLVIFISLIFQVMLRRH